MNVISQSLITVDNYTPKGPPFFHLPLFLIKNCLQSEREGKDFPCPANGCKCGYSWQLDLRRHYKTKHLALNSSAMTHRRSPRQAKVKGDRSNGSHWKWIASRHQVSAPTGAPLSTVIEEST